MKHKFPITQIRSDKTPAIWFTHEHWLLLQGSIVRAYLDNRESCGREHARRDMRKELGAKHENKRLTEWEFLDSWPQSKNQAETALRLFDVGFEAYGHIGERNNLNRWTPEKVAEFGARAEERGYTQELNLIHEAQPKATI